MKLEDYQFGFADAEKEYLLVPEIFERAFHDSRNIVGKLIYQYPFMLVGRKGVGKTAYSAKIQSIADTHNDFYAKCIPLNDFEYNTFAKTSVNDELVGTQKYKASWDFVLLLTVCRSLYSDLKITDVDELNNLLLLLAEMGFDLESNYKMDITRLSKVKMGINLKIFDLHYEKEFGHKPADYMDRINLIKQLMIDVIAKIWIEKQKLILLIDGVDDILRLKKKQLDILSSLIRSVDYLNSYFLKNKLMIKIILFIREDIAANVIDPDINKIKRDGAITLNWQNSIEDLKAIVKLRFEFSGVDKKYLDDWWYKIFPRKIRAKDSWVYVLEYTLCKPRDILQYLKSCQELYPDKEYLTYSDLQSALKSYSRSYFIEEMKNEITGFVDDDCVNSMYSVLQKMGDRPFHFAEFNKVLKEQLGKEIKENDVKYLLRLLFEAGYMGQIMNHTGKNGERKRSVIFKYRNTTASIDYYQEFITHKGLHSGLGIKL